jgi:FtsH-binding integral membrane protein
MSFQGPTGSGSFGGLGRSQSNPAADAFGKSDAGISYLRQVMAWMFLGLAITTGVAVYFSAATNVVDYLNNNPILLFALMGGSLALVFGLSFGINKVNGTVAAILFCVYAGVMGAIFALILQVYTTGSIVGAFAGAAGLFGGMALIGYTTKKDLSALGPILFAALIGLIVASIAFIFVGGSTFNLILGWGGVIIFSGLTMYDMQKIKQMGAANFGDADTTQKYAILGALSLYLDFINLFISLLRIFGNSR